MATLQQVVDGLERLTARQNDAIILQGSDAYVQASLVNEGNIKLEAVSDEFLEKPLSTAQLLALRRMGFQPPGPLSPNHWQYAATNNPAAAAELLATALTDVYGEQLEQAEIVDV